MTTAQISNLDGLTYDDLYLISDALHTALKQGSRIDKQRKIADLLMRVDAAIEKQDQGWSIGAYAPA